jgi:hypothetical protein
MRDGAEIHPGEPAETPVVISGHDIVAAYGVRGNPSGGQRDGQR